MDRTKYNEAMSLQTPLAQIKALREFLVIDLENAESEEDYEECIEIQRGIQMADIIIKEHQASLPHKKTNSENEKD